MGLKAMRMRAGLTQKQLGELIGVSACAIGRMERGLTYPQWRVVCQLAKALNCSTKDLEKEPLSADSRSNNN
ncbi:helix-turn-helix transcriptional regulator [bacterium]|nr:helix-turn-helix transcriptional regulator [bacterium]